MIHEVDDALRSLVEQDMLDGADVEIHFDAPTKDWAARRNQPTVDVYLYDVRQDLSRKQFGKVEVLNDDGSVQARRPVPTFFRLSYLVTAWTQRPEDEHRLLAALLEGFLRHETMPKDLLSGSLEDLDISIPLAIALPPPQDRALSDVWSALGGELKPSLDLNVVAPILPGREEEVGPPVEREPLLTFVDTTSGAREALGGRPPREQWRRGIVEVGRRPEPAPDDAARSTGS